MPPVAVLTLNPSLDVSYEVSRLVPDEKSRATHTRYDPGGNGVNVGRTLKILEVPAKSFTLVAGEIGLFLEHALEREVDASHCIHIPGETRVNCTLIQVDPRLQYEVTASGPEVPAAALERIRTEFVEAAGDGFGVLTGSLPPGVPPETYATWVEQLRARGARAVVDAQPAYLGRALAAEPFLIKPNRHELEMLCGTSLTTPDAVLRTARHVQQRGVTWVCVSLGAEGAILVGPRAAFLATAPRITVRSTVGAGDAMLAGLVAGFVTSGDPVTALRTGVACGSGSATHPGTMLCTRADVERLQALVEVRGIAD